MATIFNCYKSLFSLQCFRCSQSDRGGVGEGEVTRPQVQLGGVGTERVQGFPPSFYYIPENIFQK